MWVEFSFNFMNPDQQLHMLFYLDASVWMQDWLWNCIRVSIKDARADAAPGEDACFLPAAARTSEAGRVSVRCKNKLP